MVVIYLYTWKLSEVCLCMYIASMEIQKYNRSAERKGREEEEKREKRVNYSNLVHRDSSEDSIGGFMLSFFIFFFLSWF